MTNQKLWEKLTNFSLDNPEADFSFSKRLARENGWSLTYSMKVIEEYKKFIYLSIVTGRSLTPSDEVDQAWHLHLIYSYSYWVEMCSNLLGGAKLHHGPTKGGEKERVRFDNQYSETLRIYEEEFGYPPPSDAWPSNEIRFGKINFRRVNVEDNYLISKVKVRNYLGRMTAVLVSLFCGILFMSSKSDKSKEISFGDVVIFIVIFFAAIFIIRGIYRYFTRRDRRSGSSGYSSSSSSTDSGCSIFSSFFGCGGDSGCSSSGCSGGGCGGGGCGGCGGCGS
jgi:hypothetical protein